MDHKSKNITRVLHRVPTEWRSRSNGHVGGIVWFTGLSGSGKTTLAFELEHKLFARGLQVFVLDGDNIRHQLSSDLGFSPGDRTENIRRVGEVAALFAEAGMIVLSSFISPYRSDRRHARAAAGSNFHEIHLSVTLEACEGRDPKGLYEKARRGEIEEFTGVSAPYETPDQPELALDTGVQTVEESVTELMAYMERHFDRRGTI